jgi:hypothetical protein
MTIVYGFFAALMLFGLWRIWRNRHGVIAERKDPDFDVAEGQPEVREALDLMHAKNWPALTKLYWGMSPSDRYHMIESAGELAFNGPPDIPEDADSALLTITGGMQLMHGMRVKGKGSAVAAYKADGKRMMDDMRAAAARLREAGNRNPNDSTNLALQIRYEVVLNGDEAHINSLVGRAQASGEDNIYIALNHLLGFTPNPRRSADRMWRVANEWASSPPNAAWFAIPARAHIEEWRYAMACPPATPERSSMIDLMSDEGFRRHLVKIDDAFWSARERKAIDGAEFSLAHNHLAFLMHLFHIEDRARAHLEQIGPHVSRYPWAYLPTGQTRPTLLLADLRRQYGLPALQA